jgi:DNA-binding transcriptional regulator GbsR (MarR family)
MAAPDELSNAAANAPPDAITDVEDDMRGEALTSEKTRFIEGMGRYFEQFGISRIGGRILGLLMLAEDPLSLDDMATTLSVSRASISTNIRLITASGLAELVTKPGDRRDYYRFTDDAWGHSLNIELKSLLPLRRMAARALAALEPDDQMARAQLEDLVDFCDFFIEEHHRIIARWRERLRARGRLPHDEHDGTC